MIPSVLFTPGAVEWALPLHRPTRHLDERRDIKLGVVICAAQQSALPTLIISNITISVGLSVSVAATSKPSLTASAAICCNDHNYPGDHHLSHRNRFPNCSTPYVQLGFNKLNKTVNGLLFNYNSRD